MKAVLSFLQHCGSCSRHVLGRQKLPRK